MGQQVKLDSFKNIVVKLSGEVTTQEVETVASEVTRLANSLDRIMVIMDVSDLDKVPPKAREAMTKNPMPQSEKIAVIGATSVVRVLGTLVIKSDAQHETVAFF